MDAFGSSGRTTVSLIFQKRLLKVRSAESVMPADHQRACRLVGEKLNADNSLSPVRVELSVRCGGIAALLRADFAAVFPVLLACITQNTVFLCAFTTHEEAYDARESVQETSKFDPKTFFRLSTHAERSRVFCARSTLFRVTVRCGFLYLHGSVNLPRSPAIGAAFTIPGTSDFEQRLAPGRPNLPAQVGHRQESIVAVTEDTDTKSTNKASPGTRIFRMVVRGYHVSTEHPIREELILLTSQLQ